MYDRTLPLFQPKHLICPDIFAQNTTNLYRSYMPVYAVLPLALYQDILLAFM
jgi:hypothetical protein